ncbi:hypothetical protein [Proteiniclasticum sp.]|uniref:hypothetical protein n=1 Tax=Proteiniclasticum sp. TaxID=2053595 RepID=UPI00289B66A7|nr:hypothetical protein [Proteiniclasticum sp.]
MLKKSLMVFLILLMTSSVVTLLTGCQEKTIYQEKIAVDLVSLPFYESTLKYNAEPSMEMQSKLYDYFFNDKEEKEYIIVTNDGKEIGEKIIDVLPESGSDLYPIVEKIKESGYKVLYRDYYYVTTVEDEIIATFNGERELYPNNKYSKFIEDNTGAYKNKDYSTINDYIIKNNIMIFSKTITEERKTNP